MSNEALALCLNSDIALHHPVPFQHIRWPLLSHLPLDVNKASALLTPDSRQTHRNSDSPKPFIPNLTLSFCKTTQTSCLGTLLQPVSTHPTRHSSPTDKPTAGGGGSWNSGNNDTPAGGGGGWYSSSNNVADGGHEDINGHENGYDGLDSKHAGGNSGECYNCGQTG